MYIEQLCSKVHHRYLQGFYRHPSNHRLSAATARQHQCMLAFRIRQHKRADRQTFLTFAEALSEALYLFQCRSSLPQAGSTVNHCLVFSLTEAHNMAIDWPYPLASASSDQVSITPLAAFCMVCVAVLLHGHVSPCTSCNLGPVSV